MGAAGLQEVEGAVDVGGDEVAGAGDAAVHMTFCGKVHDVGDVMLTNDAEDFVFIAEIDLLEDVTWMDSVDTDEVFEMPGISEAVEIDQPSDFRLVDDMPDEVRADETSPACDQEIHALLIPTRRTSEARSAR